MKLVLIQISDIHLRSNADPILFRVQQIAKAILGVQYQADIHIIALSGDVAFSGVELEYLIACEFFQGIINSLREALGPDSLIQFVAIPGNHDCDFSAPQAVRQLIIDSLDRQKHEVDGGVVEICMEVQKTFFDFRDTIEGEKSQRSLAWERKISTPEGCILFRCFNTSWLSQLNEVPGKLFFPIEMANGERSNENIVISLLHHPYNWFDPNNAKILRTHVERTSDIVLTGHEHIQKRRIQFNDTGEVNEYIEGGVLQESGESSISSFNVLIVNTNMEQQKFIRYVWNGNIYQPHGPGSVWESYQVNRLREDNRFTINDSFQSYLQDLGVRLEHPKKGVLNLADVFVYPDLREVSDRIGEVSQKEIRGEELFNECQEDSLLILGVEQSGKSSLAKTLFREYHKRGYVPLFIDGASFHITKLDHLIDQQFIELFGGQYSTDSIEYYKQLDRDKRVVVIDNFHSLRFRRKEEEKLLDILERFAGKLVFFANDLVQQVNKIVEGGIIIGRRQKYRQFRILPFGHVRRNALVEQWCLLSHDQRQDEESLAKNVITIERVIDTVIGKNFIPAYPVFLLAMLQAQEGSTPFNTSAGTYGYFYELLIRNSLAHGSDKVQLDIKLGYLAYLAFETYQAGNRLLSSSELQGIHERYQERYAFKLHYQTSRQELVKYGILDNLEDAFKFKYKYIYYYFVASFLKDHITEQPIRDEITKLSSRLDDEDSANIMLFLAHLSKDPFIIDQMLEKATSQYAEFEPARLADDAIFLHTDGQRLSNRYIEKDVATSRREHLERLDRAEQNERSEPLAPDTSKEELDFKIMSRLTAALRTMQILGQLLKNFVGTMEGVQKQQIARECYSLGLRILSSILHLLKSNQTELIQYFIETFREEHSDHSDRELEEIARESIFGIAHMVAYGTVKRISRAVGSRDLDETYNAIRNELKSPAVDLVHISIELDQLRLFPQKDVIAIGEALEKLHLPASVLRHLVINHFYLYNVHFQVKQSICSKLGISYQQVQQFNPANKLLISAPQRSREYIK